VDKRRLTGFRNPSAMMFLGDAHDNQFSNANVSYRISTVRLHPIEVSLPECMRHAGATAGNYLFIDGHVELKLLAWLLAEPPGSPFWDTYQTAQ
jgi:prepilin-type processing-associated H-X9-DG protein